MVHGAVGNNVPRVGFAEAKCVMETLSSASAKGLVRSIHDCAEGGIGVACAEMAFAGGLGIKIDLSKVPLGDPLDRDDRILFSESNTRFVVEVDPDVKSDFEGAMRNVPIGLVGAVTESSEFVVKGLGGKVRVKMDIADLKEAWQRPLRW
jgi:phosphoribosylformylglycinamidine synthase